MIEKRITQKQLRKQTKNRKNRKIIETVRGYKINFEVRSGGRITLIVSDVFEYLSLGTIFAPHFMRHFFGIVEILQSRVLE